MRHGPSRAAPQRAQRGRVRGDSPGARGAARLPDRQGPVAACAAGLRAARRPERRVSAVSETPRSLDRRGRRSSGSHRSALRRGLRPHCRDYRPADAVAGAEGHPRAANFTLVSKAFANTVALMAFDTKIMSASNDYVAKSKPKL